MAMIQMPSEATVTGQGLESPFPGIGGRARSPIARARLRMATAIRSNRKASVGFGLLVLFCLVGAFPGVIAKDDPTAIIFAPRLGPSTSHLLGTTGLGQDMFAQLAYGTRPV